MSLPGWLEPLPDAEPQRELDAWAIEPHQVVHPGVTGRQFGTSLSQPPNWIASELDAEFASGLPDRQGRE